MVRMQKLIFQLQVLFNLFFCTSAPDAFVAVFPSDFASRFGGKFFTAEQGKITQYLVHQQ